MSRKPLLASLTQYSNKKLNRDFRLPLQQQAGAQWHFHPPPCPADSC
jgi:hypothetical protein